MYAVRSTDGTLLASTRDPDVAERLAAMLDAYITSDNTVRGCPPAWYWDQLAAQINRRDCLGTSLGGIGYRAADG